MDAMEIANSIGRIWRGGGGIKNGLKMDVPTGQMETDGQLNIGETEDEMLREI
jgi:hypothetical protein